MNTNASDSEKTPAPSERQPAKARGARRAVKNVKPAKKARRTNAETKPKARQANKKRAVTASRLYRTAGTLTSDSAVPGIWSGKRANFRGRISQVISSKTSSTIAAVRAGDQMTLTPEPDSDHTK
jgi:hypothetical protein